MRDKKYFSKGSKWAKPFIAYIAALFLFTGTACASKAPLQTPQSPEAPAAPDTPAAPEASQVPEDAASSETPQAPDTPAAPESPQAPAPQTPTGTEGLISSEDARNAALADAGIAASEATFTKEKLDYEDGIAVYDLEFYTSTREYEYEINAATGAVYSKSTETFQDGHTQHNDHTHGSAASGSSSDIGMENAKSIALEHAGLSADGVTFSKAKLDTEDGRLVYEIEFYGNGREYEYELLASDGSILKYEVD